MRDILATAAAECFPVQKWQSRKAEGALKEERRRLVRQRAEVRQQLAEFGEEYWRIAPDVCGTDSWLAEKARRIGRQLRRWRRRDQAARQRRLLREMEAAVEMRKEAEVHKLAHTMAGRGRGTRKRMFRHLPGLRPDRREVEQFVELDGAGGGMAARVIDKEVLLADFLLGYPDLAPRTKTLEMQAQEDLKETAWHLRRSAKRKATEVFLMAMLPRYLSVGDKVKSGVGAAQVSSFEAKYDAAANELLVHVRRADRLPHEANYSLAFLLDKRNQKVGMPMIHAVCSFWKSVVGGMMQSGMRRKAEEHYDDRMPAWAHGFLSSRRRESAMLVQRCMGYKLDKLKIQHMNELMDMANAFPSVAQVAFVEAAEEIFLQRDWHILNERVRNSIVLVPLVEGGFVEFVPGDGGLMGRSETPRLFIEAFNHPVEKWMDETRDPMMWLTDDVVEGAGCDGSLVAFADDLLRKHRVEEGEEAFQDLERSEERINIELSHIKMKQNGSKREIVPRLKGGAATRKFQECIKMREKGKAISWARHLGGAYVYNGSNAPDVKRRLHAVDAAWCSYGAILG